MIMEAYAKLKTPMVSRKTRFHLKGCKWEIKPRFRYYAKINVSIPMIPYHYNSYLGTFTVSYKCRTEEVGRRKLKDLLQITHVGRYKSEGCGELEWEGYRFVKEPKIFPKKYGKIKIRKGLDPKLPGAIKDLVRFHLLHDFVHTSIHSSKIFVEIDIKNTYLLGLLRQSHDNIDHILLQTASYYDQLAAIITRRKKSPRDNRYNWKWEKQRKRIDFTQLARKIGQIVNTQSLGKLYTHIYNSEELGLLNESYQFGHSSLRYHLVLGANLIVRDYYKGKLDSFVNNYDKNAHESIHRRKFQ